MCGIAGIVTAESQELGRPLRRMLEALEHRGPDGAGYVLGGVCERGKSLDALDFESRKTTVALGHVRLAITGGSTGIQPFQSADHRLSLLHNGEIYNHEELSKELDDRGLTTGSDSEVMLRMIEAEYDGNLLDAVERVLPKLDGVYALVVSDQKQTIVARDKIGVRPLYYAIEGDTVAFASERRPLSEVGTDSSDTRRLPPGHMIVVENGNHEILSFWRPDELRSTRTFTEMSAAVAAYATVMEEAVRKRVHNHDHVGVIFSGGIDSFLVAYLVDKIGVPFTCYVAGREGSSDTEWSLELAKQHGWDLNVATLSNEDIAALIPDVMTVIEDHSLIQVEVAIPIFASVRRAQAAGERVILTGQGADELFGGYSWYPTIVAREGYDAFIKRAWEDTILLYRECLEREDKISMAHSVELRVPFLDPDVVQTAFEIAPQLKIESGDDKFGKRIHREYALSIGIPHNISYRSKEAAQHGANVHDAIEELATAAGITRARVTALGYDPDQTVLETLGSCSRYGYRYGQEDMWRAAPHVQYYLDRHAAELNMLAPSAQEHWETVQARMRETTEPKLEECGAC